MNENEIVAIGKTNEQPMHARSRLASSHPISLKLLDNSLLAFTIVAAVFQNKC
jgi:hypothetical protein